MVVRAVGSDCLIRLSAVSYEHAKKKEAIFKLDSTSPILWNLQYYFLLKCIYQFINSMQKISTTLF